jgi:hypothetical protein
MLTHSTRTRVHRDPMRRYLTSFAMPSWACGHRQAGRHKDRGARRGGKGTWSARAAPKTSMRPPRWYACTLNVADSAAVEGKRGNKLRRMCRLPPMLHVFIPTVPVAGVDQPSPTPSPTDPVPRAAPVPPRACARTQTHAHQPAARDCARAWQRRAGAQTSGSPPPPRTALARPQLPRPAAPAQRVTRGSRQRLTITQIRNALHVCTASASCTQQARRLWLWLCTTNRGRGRCSPRPASRPGSRPRRRRCKALPTAPRLRPRRRPSSTSSRCRWHCRPPPCHSAPLRVVSCLHADAARCAHAGAHRRTATPARRKGALACQRKDQSQRPARPLSVVPQRVLPRRGRGREFGPGQGTATTRSHAEQRRVNRRSRGALMVRGVTPHPGTAVIPSIPRPP